MSAVVSWVVKDPVWVLDVDRIELLLALEVAAMLVVILVAVLMGVMT